METDRVIWLLQFMHLFPNADHCLGLCYFSWLQNTIYVSHFELHTFITVMFLKGFVPFLVFTMSTWNANQIFICKSNLRGANTVFQPYHSEIFVPDHHSSLFSFIFVFRELDCILMLMSDWVFCFLIFSRICVCSFEIFSFRWNAIFFSICKYSFIVSLVDLTGKCWNVKCIRASYSKN